MKARNLALIVALVVIADQALKIYIKTTLPLNTSREMLGESFQLYFVENPGMAYGWKFGGEWGKVALTVFRLIAVSGKHYKKEIPQRVYHHGRACVCWCHWQFN